jgi:cell wall-associated NlpC family hydrolase
MPVNGGLDRSSWLAIWALALALSSTACASTGAVPKPFPMPGGAPARAPAAPADPAAVPDPDALPRAPVRGPHSNIDGYALAGTALGLRGTPYRDGGTDLTGFDCSGFTQYVYAQYGVALPREVREQFRVGKSVKAEDLAAGDMIFFTTTARGATHVAIAIGGDQFVHAPSSTGVVRVERIGSSYWAPRYLGARRIKN